MNQSFNLEEINDQFAHILKFQSSTDYNIYQLKINLKNLKKKEDAVHVFEKVYHKHITEEIFRDAPTDKTRLGPFVYIYKDVELSQVLYCFIAAPEVLAESIELTLGFGALSRHSRKIASLHLTHFSIQELEIRYPLIELSDMRVIAGGICIDDHAQASFDELLERVAMSDYL